MNSFSAGGSLKISLTKDLLTSVPEVHMLHSWLHRKLKKKWRRNKKLKKKH